jgi:hypothetical protein
MRNGNEHGWNEWEEFEAGTTEDGEPLPFTIIEPEIFEDWRRIGEDLVKTTAEAQFAIGDWLCRGEDLKEMAGLGGEDQNFKNSIYGAAAEITGYSYLTLKSLASVARNISKEMRADFRLSFAHFKLVASPSLADDKKRELLADMDRNSRNVATSRDMVRLRLEIPRKGKDQPKASRLIRHCDGVVAELEGYDGLSETVVQKLVRTRDAIGEVLAQLQIPEVG